MTRTTFASTAALIALVAGTAPAMAQTAAPEAGGDLPELLQGMDLSRVSSETKRDGQRTYDGYLPDGTEIEADYDMAGNLIKIDADDGILPAPVIDAALPGAVRDSAALDLFARFEQIRMDPRGTQVSGWQSSGAEIEAKFDPDNALIEIKTDDSALPQGIIDAILPQSVRSAEVLTQFGMIEAVKAEYGRFQINGRDTTGEEMRAQLDEAGAVLRFGRDDGPEGGPEHDRGPKHDRAEGDDDDGPRGDDHRGDGPRGDDHRGDGRAKAGQPDGPRAAMRGDGPAGQPAAPQFDAVAANRRLTEAGYSQFGLLRQNGPGAMLEATNPDGDTVMLELDAEGQLVRETAR